MKQVYKVLSVAGSDPSGGAGIQADIKTITSLGCYAMAAPSAITVQNTVGVDSVYPLPGELVKQQIVKVLQDIKPDSLKIGMLKTRDIVLNVADALKETECFVVLDPIIASTSGHRLLDDDALEAMLTELVPRCTLVTPNLNEAEIIVGHSIEGVEQMIEAGRELMQRGFRNVLMKGGHLKGNQMTDILIGKDVENSYALFTSTKIESRNTHGTGCTLSSAIASFKARGCTLAESVEQAKQYLSEAIEAARELEIGNGHGPVDHTFAPSALLIKQ